MNYFAQVITEASKAVETVETVETSLLNQSLLPLVVAVVVFGLLKFVLKISIVAVVIGTVATLIISGVVSFSVF